MLPLLLKKAFAELKKNDPLQLAGATAFFTTFALPPILLILLQLFGLFFSRRFIDKQLFARLTDVMGKEVAHQIRQTLINLGKLAENWYVTVGGFLFLLFVATTLFSVIKNSLNQVWNIKVVTDPGILFNLKIRTRSLGIIVLAGILFLAGLLFDGLQVILGKYMGELWPGVRIFFKTFLKEIIGLVIVTTWFVLVFRFLANGRPTWKAAMAGGLLTGILFTGGKILINRLLASSNISTIYGTSASIILVLLFVFYSSFILYYGASFIKVYSDETDQPILAMDKAYRYELHELMD